MAEQSVVGVFDSMADAENAIRSLDQGGFPITQVSVLAQNLASENQVHGYVTACDVSQIGAKAGAWTGGLFGLLVGAAFLWVPGVGPLVIAGPLSAALLGGIEGAFVGAAAGGFLGGLAGWGISKQHILKYEQKIQAGKYLVVAHGSADEVKKANGILSGTKPTELDLHAA